MTALTDIHSHILPGVDDGAADMEQTLSMAEAAYAQGVRTMIATPHYYPGHARLPREMVEEVYRETAAEIKKRHEDFTLLLGNEVFYREEAVPKIRAGRICTLAGSRYVLIETAPSTPYGKIAGAVRSLVDAGYCPILAHIERYACLFKNREGIKDLVELGAFMQVNAEALAGGIFSPGRGFVIKLMKEGLIHFLGSDCHDMDGRRPDLGDAAKILQAKLPPETFRRLLEENPKRLLADQYL